MNLTALITAHYLHTNKIWPDTWQGMGWIATEYSEAWKLLLYKDPPGWVRNNPDDEEPYSPERFEEELGDIMFMAQVTGMREGLDPHTAMVEKLSKGLPDLSEPEPQDQLSPTQVKVLLQALRQLMFAADDGEWHLAEDCRVEGFQDECRLCRKLFKAQDVLDDLEKWDEWHNGIPAPDVDLTDLPLFKEEECSDDSS